MMGPPEGGREWSRGNGRTRGGAAAGEGDAEARGSVPGVPTSAPYLRLSDAAPTPEELLKRVGLEAFRPGQREAVSAALEGRDALVVMPTGAGKSLCYQLPALAGRGLVVVVSPLIALMADQLQRLQGALGGLRHPTLVGASRSGVGMVPLRISCMCADRSCPAAKH